MFVGLHRSTPTRRQNSVEFHLEALREGESRLGDLAACSSQFASAT